MAFSGIQAETVKFQGFNGDSGEAYYARASAAGEYPGVVVIHHFPGWDEWTAEVVRKFADHGYAAIAPSLYFRLGDGASPEVVSRARAAGGMPDDQLGFGPCFLMRLSRAQFFSSLGRTVQVEAKSLKIR